MDWVGSLKRTAPLCAAALTFLVAGEAAAERVVFINLEGVTLNADNGQDPTLDSYSSNGFTAGAVSGITLSAEEITLLHFYLKEATTPFEIEYVFERPVDPGYDMVVFGSEDDANARFVDSDCPPAIGLADCGDSSGQNISFVFQGCLPAAQQTDMRRLAYYSLTGLGFGWGLENESTVGQLMGSYSVFGLQFGDECVSIVGGNEECLHPVCAAGLQNATEDLNAIVGERIDDGPPEVVITGPINGSTVDPVFAITADVADAFGGLEVALSAEIAGTPISEERVEPPYEWDFNGVPPGTWTFDVNVTDADGGVATASVTVTVSGATTGGDDTTGGADDTGSDPTVDPTGDTEDPSTSGATVDPTGATSAGTEGGGEGSTGAPIDPTEPVDPAAFGVGGTGCGCTTPKGDGWGGIASLTMLVLGATASRRRGRTSTRPSRTSSRRGRTSR